LGLTQIIRAGEWWEYKLVPILAALYGTALMAGVPVHALWPAAVTLLLALIPGAAYVSVINDLTDREEDLAAGKPNRFAEGSRGWGAVLVVLTVGAGVVFCVLWRRDTLLLTTYLAAWLAFSLYSLPPFRWKTQGILGVLCDASGANLFPTLLAVILACRAAGQAVSGLWLAAVGTWAFANGLRGILWHQLTDREHDRQAGVRTFAQRHAPEVTVRLGRLLAFPLELLGLGTMLVLLPSTVPVWTLGAYGILTGLRRVRLNVHPVIVKPRTRFLIAMHEYYDLFLPVGILIASALRHPWDWAVLLVHLLLFPNRLLQTCRDLGQLWRERHEPRHY
jgi:4-hydroxybenzoate polyprenyltransferase